MGGIDTDAVCVSTSHVDAVPAVVSGTFDPGPVNGRPVSMVSYCLRCAVATEYGGLFEPQRALAPLPVVADVYADKLTDDWSLADQEALLDDAAPKTLTLLRSVTGLR